MPAVSANIKVIFIYLLVVPEGLYSVLEISAKNLYENLVILVLDIPAKPSAFSVILLYVDESAVTEATVMLPKLVEP